MGDIIRYITRPDASVDDRYLKVVSERERERRLQLVEEKKEERRRVGILKKIFPDAKSIRGVKFISVYDLAGNYEATYAGAASAGKALGVKPNSIWSAIGRKDIQVAGKQVRVTEIAWIDGNPMVSRRSIGPARGRIKSIPPMPVSVYDLDGYYLETFKTLNECADALDVLVSQICRVLHAVGREKGPRQSRGYQFRKAKWMDGWDGGHWDTRRIKPYTGKYRMKYIHKEYNRKTLNQ